MGSSLITITCRLWHLSESSHVVFVGNVSVGVGVVVHNEVIVIGTLVKGGYSTEVT